MTDSILITPVSGPISGSIRPPGSKSLTNRALIVAALAEGRSRLTGVLDSQDTQVMIASLNRLGIRVTNDTSSCVADVDGCGGTPVSTEAELFLENSGTSIRFLTALCTLGHGTYRLDGNTRMQERPIGDLLVALRELGADARSETNNDCPPVVVHASGLPGGSAQVAGNISSQYLSALLMAAPCAQSPVDIEVRGELVSVPYIDMTLGVMSSFGVNVEQERPGCYSLAPAAYRATDHDVEPDASAASYFFAAAAITGGEVTVKGLARHALQGDVRFVEALVEMGCTARYDDDSITLTGGALHGIDIDMNAISDTAQTLAAVAVFADGPTSIRNIAHVRHKETDRIAAVTNELGRLSIRVDERDDGLTIHPGAPQAATVKTYDDHRMAMSFALIGLCADGIRIADPACTGKTYPNFFDDLADLCGTRS